MGFEGMDELLAQVKEIATGREFDECNKNIIKKSMVLAKDKLKDNMPESKDLSKSGKTGYRPSKHSKDAIPVGKIKSKNGYYGGLVGWDKADTSENFYIAFKNFGTTKMKPEGFIQKTYDEIDKQCEEIAKEEYENLVKKLGDI